MFPGIDGFHWTLGHILFLALFFAVAFTILATIAWAGWRTSCDFRSHRAIGLWWRSEFAELPAADRRCRHQLAGRVISRTCDNAFDCRDCEKYSQYAVLPTTGNLDSLGLDYSPDRYYHRGHTWVEPAADGTVTVGLDELAAHLVGTPDFVDLPETGEDIEVNQTAWRMKKNGHEIRVRAPIEGTVMGVGGPNKNWYLKIRPRLDLREPRTLRHLLRGAEVHGWLSQELDRLQLQLRAPNTPAALADGGVLMPDLMNAIPDADWEPVLADTFLQA
jgi:glycine cleavage system H lipoate-binding protein